MTEAPPPPRKRRLAFWRTERGQKFVREVGSVVLGVLIALGLGAVATEIGWRLEVYYARHAMEVELGELIGQGEERNNIHRCFEARFDALSVIVDTAAKGGKLPPLGNIGSPPWRTWPRGIWASTQGETAAHMNRDLLDNYSSAYEFADALAALGAREIDVWTRLYALVGPGRALDAEEAAELRRTIGEARMINRMTVSNGLRLKQLVIAYDLGYDPGSAEAYATRPIRDFPICSPIGTAVPGTYGQAPFDTMVERVKANPFTNKKGSGVPSAK